jgi:L-iditol 2-dehydrogenase
MKVAQLVQPEKIQIEDVEMPDLSPTEVLVQLQSCGVCATDVKKFTGGSKAPHLPFILGHEPAGIVKDIGKSVEADISLGDRVSIAPVFTCGYCHACRSGLVYSQGMGMCENYQVLGYSIDGAFGEYVSVPAQFVFPIPDELTFRDAALIEPIAACLNGVQRGLPQPSGTVVVLGAGFMGLVCVQLYKLFGNRVIATDLLEERRKAAEKQGADVVLDPQQSDVLKEVMDITGSRGADAVLCSVGGKKITEDAMGMLKKGGALVLLASAPGGTKFEVDLNKLHYDQSVITGSVSYTGPGYEWTIQALRQGLLDVDALISHSGPLEQTEEFLKMTRDLKGLKKVVLF